MKNPHSHPAHRNVPEKEMVDSPNMTDAAKARSDKWLAELNAPTRFRDLSVGDTFDFVNDAKPHLNSYFHRCVKTSMRGYKPIDGECVSMRVGTMSVEVFHVKPRERNLSLPATIWQAELNRRASK